MKTIKRRFEQYLFYDYTGIEAHLEKMAINGWQINKITPFYWEYRRIEPRKLTYAVTYFSEASEFNPFPTENQQTFREYCKDVGWELVAEWAQMQIFCTEQENPVPIETEESVKLKAIHKAMKKNFLPSSVVMLLLALFQIVFQINIIAEDPVYFLSNVTSLSTVLIWNILALYMLINLIGYSVWYYKSKKSISVGGSCIESNYGYKKTSYFMWILLGITILVSVVSLSTQHFGWIGIIGIVNTTLLIALVHIIKSSLKRAKASRRINIIITIASCLIMSFVLTGAMAWGILQEINAGWFKNHQPVDTYTINMPNGSNHTWDIYKDELPLKIEDFQNVNYEHYSYEWTVKESLLLGQFIARQDSFPDGQRAPELRYEIVEVKVDSLFEICLKDYLEMYNYDWEEPIEDKLYFLQVEEPVWQADKVYQLHVQNEALEEYILCWGNRIVYINFDKIPTAEQVTIVVEKLKG